MSGKITKITYQKHNQTRVNIFIDDAFAFALPDVATTDLEVGQTLTDTAIAQLQQVDTEAKALDRTLRFLAHRPRSRDEIERYLKKKEYSLTTIQAVTAKLQRLGYLNDQMFAEWWVENRTRFKPRSRRALQHELRRKGISEGIIAQALAGVDDEDQVLALARQRSQRWRHLPRPDYDKKMLGFLHRRGFGYACARHAVEQSFIELHDDEDGHAPS